MEIESEGQVVETLLAAVTPRTRWPTSAGSRARRRRSCRSPRSSGPSTPEASTRSSTGARAGHGRRRHRGPRRGYSTANGHSGRARRRARASSTSARIAGTASDRSSSATASTTSGRAVAPLEGVRLDRHRRPDALPRPPGRPADDRGSPRRRLARCQARQPRPGDRGPAAHRGAIGVTPQSRSDGRVDGDDPPPHRADAGRGDRCLQGLDRGRGSHRGPGLRLARAGGPRGTRRAADGRRPPHLSRALQRAADYERLAAALVRRLG